MTVESSNALGIAALFDWLKNLAADFQPMRSKNKTNCTLYGRYFLRFEQEFWANWGRLLKSWLALTIGLGVSKPIRFNGS